MSRKRKKKKDRKIHDELGDYYEDMGKGSNKLKKRILW